MKTIKFLSLFLIIFLVISFQPFISAKETDSAKAYRDKITHAGFKKIQGFGHISVSVLGSAEKLGISEKELTDFLKLKIKNNFAGIKILTPKQLIQVCGNESAEEFLNNNNPFCSSEKIGYISLEICTARKDYPIVLHINCKAGSIKHYHLLESGLACSPIIWEKNLLGYGSKDSVPDGIRKSIERLIQDLAIVFYKVRGEL